MLSNLFRTVTAVTKIKMHKETKCFGNIKRKTNRGKRASFFDIKGVSNIELANRKFLEERKVANQFGSENETRVTLEADRTGIVEEPPFRMLVLGDWSGDGEKKAASGRKPIEIDRDNFDEVMEKLGVKAEISIGDGETLSLQFNELDDFHPDNIFRRLDIFTKLRSLRKDLNNDDSFYRAAREVRGMFDVGDGMPAATEPAKQEEAPADNLLDAILGQPSGGAPKPKPKTSSDLSNLVSNLVRPHLVSVDENEKAGMIAAIDAATSSLMLSILRDKKFKELEAAWRGLYFLVRRTETSTDLNSATPSPSASRSRVMRLAEGVAAPARPSSQPITTSVIPAFGRGGELDSATRMSPLGSR